MAKERILCAAVLFNGLIISGYRHYNCYEVIEKLGNVPQNLWPGSDSHGFLTSHNRFVNRREGYLIAKENNQLLLPPKEDDSEDILTSEDLYFEGY